MFLNSLADCKIMEELQTTEILDNEILEDARKKAWRILKTAEKTVAALASEWEKKTNESLKDLRNKYAKRSETSKREILSRLPMEKRRIKVKVIDRLLNQAAEAWYLGLDHVFAVKLLRNELKIRLAECDEFRDNSWKVHYSNISDAEAAELIRALLPMNNFTLEKSKTSDIYPEIIMDSDNVRICASLGKAADFLMLDKRKELISALIGDNIFDDGKEPDVPLAGVKL